MSIVTTILAFLVTIGLLVAVHEFGHFWVARKLGVKVLRFSIGFGPRLWTKRGKDADQVEYALSAIPLGGYVKMLDEREGEVAEADRPRAFNVQPVWKRILIVLAGPVFNFIFAIAAFALTYMVGIDSVRPYLDAPKPNTPAAVSGFKAGDRVVSLQGDEVVSANQLRMGLLSQYLDQPVLELGVEQADGTRVTRTLDLNNTVLLEDEGDHFEKIGLNMQRPAGIPIVGEVMKGTPAERAGLLSGDKITKVDDQVIASPNFFSTYINGNAGKQVSLAIERDQSLMSVDVTPEAREHEGKTVGLIGISMGYHISDADRDRLFFVRHASLGEALWMGVKETWDMSIMTLRVMGRLITGEASIKNISGPITIANYAGKTAVIGFSVFVSFLAIISLSLGVLNLLPVPMLDGGHLLYYLIEIIKGSPVSEKVEEMGMRLGMAMVGVLMVLALYNDITRLVS